MGQHLLADARADAYGTARAIEKCPLKKMDSVARTRRKDAPPSMAKRARNAVRAKPNNDISKGRPSLLCCVAFLVKTEEERVNREFRGVEHVSPRR